MPRLVPKFLQRIKEQVADRVESRIRRELAPETPTPGTPGEEDEESLPAEFLGRIKEEAKRRLLKLSPIQRRLLDPTQPLDEPTKKYRIHFAGENRTLLYLSYNGQYRHVEPYSYRLSGKPEFPGGPRTLLFYGYCRLHDEIHAFKLGKIKDMVTTNETFRPRWEIEV